MGVVSGLEAALRGRTVLVTGHTGFKGGWLSLWLDRLGADVHGLALEPPTVPSLFGVCDLETIVDHRLGDIAAYSVVRERVLDVRPEVIFHLAAQPIVRYSYDEPLETWQSNVMGTAHVLEAVRERQAPCVVVVISSDKCYANQNWVWGYRETDPLGGSDPYSASKAGTELVTDSYRASFFGESSDVRVASARAGNVIGGGDWAPDRIVPDCIRAFTAGEQVMLRSPQATRPWQHVLEPLSGYLLLASKLLGDAGVDYDGGWNFGPRAQDVQPVARLVQRLVHHWGEGADWDVSAGPHPKEAARLALNCDKAIHLLGWSPAWDLEVAVEKTATWYRAWLGADRSLRNLTLEQIADFESDLERRAIAR